MKKKKLLSDLLRKIEEAQGTTNGEIVNLNDQLNKKILKGGYQYYNGVCAIGSSNSSCINSACAGSSNGSCYNFGCLI
jgi:hypothetical protein